MSIPLTEVDTHSRLSAVETQVEGFATALDGVKNDVKGVRDSVDRLASAITIRLDAVAEKARVPATTTFQAVALSMALMTAVASGWLAFFNRGSLANEEIARLHTDAARERADLQVARLDAELDALALRVSDNHAEIVATDTRVQREMRDLDAGETAASQERHLSQQSQIEGLRERLNWLERQKP